MSSVKAPPALNLHGPNSSHSISLEDEEMHEIEEQQPKQQCSSPNSALKSPKSGKNTLGLTLPGSVHSPAGGGGICAHSVDSIMQFDGHSSTIGTSHNHLHLQQQPPPPPRSPPRRIILEAEKTLREPTPMNNHHHLLKTPPLICEQGPSAPSSPTTHSPDARSAKRPCPLSVDALKRINLLSPNYIPPCHSTMDAHKLPPPISPSYPTSDLGSSPRSSISASHYSSLGINAANWSAFRDAYARRHGTGGGSSADGEDGTGSEFGTGQLNPAELHLLLKEGGGRHSSAALLSPHQLLSPAPFSPFSDCGVADLHVASVSGTPYSSRSPNLSPSPMRRSSNLHFSFEQIRSRSSLSNHANGNNAHLHNLSTIGHQPRSLDMDARERSRSEGEALGCGTGTQTSGGLMEDERMDTSSGHGHSTLSVPAGSSGQHLHAGQKRRLLQKSRRAEEEEEVMEQRQQRRASAIQGQSIGGGGTISQQDSLNGPGPSASQMPSRQPTIEEPPPSPTLAELFQPGDLDKDRRRQVEDWIRQQTAALEAFRHSLVPPQQEANLLQVPTIVPQNSLEQLWPDPSAANSQVGPIRSPTLWRRSRSESDVSAATSAAAGGNASGGGTPTPSKGRRQSHQTQQAPKLMVPLNEATHVCEHCGQGFSMHDRLAKHIASRHRDRSSSMNDENNRVHKCTLCPKSFGRSDMLTRHMRLHTGLKPYACHLCGQVFSRSDHLSTHQRTHTGEKPYRCPQCNYTASRRDMITRHMRTHLLGGDGSACTFTELQIPPINELSLNPPPTNPPSSTQQQPPLPPQQPTIPSVSVPSTAHQNGNATNEGTNIGTNILPQANLSTTATVGGSPSHQTTPPAAVGNMEHQRMTVPTTNMTTPMATNPVAGPSNSSLNEQIASLLSAAVANGAAAGLLGPQLMFGSLGAQLPAHLRRSTPNLLGGPADYPYASAFRPPPSQTLLGASPSLPSTGTSTLDPAIAAAAAVQVQQLISQQQQRLSLPGGSTAGMGGGQNSTALPFLLRQNSFGGLGFSEQHHQGGGGNFQHQEWPK